MFDRASKRGPSVYLRDHGVTAISFDRLDALLARHGLVIHAGKVRYVRCLTECQAAEAAARQTKRGIWLLGERCKGPQDGRRRVGISK